MNHISELEAKSLMGNNMIGREEIAKLTSMNLRLVKLVPEIQYSREELEKIVQKG